MTGEAARAIGKAMVICLAPDVCLTPVGPAQVPVPYMIMTTLDKSLKTSMTVHLKGKRAFLLDQSQVSRVMGDEPGTSKGIKSGTVGGKAEPIMGSKTVKINGKPVVRHGDRFSMNQGNTIGILIFQGASGGSFSFGGGSSKSPGDGARIS